MLYRCTRRALAIAWALELLTLFFFKRLLKKNNASWRIHENSRHSFLRDATTIPRSQLYRVREEKYVLDLQRLEGDAFFWLDLCAALLTEISL